MRLAVTITCMDCHRQVYVQVDGRTFDIAALEHDCDAVRAFELTRATDAAQLELAA